MANAFIDGIRDRFSNIFGNGYSQENIEEGVVDSRNGFGNYDVAKLIFVLKNLDSNYDTYKSRANIDVNRVLAHNFFIGNQGHYILGQEMMQTMDNMILDCATSYQQQATQKNPEPIVTTEMIEIQGLDEMGNPVVVDKIDQGAAISTALNEIADSNGLLSLGKIAVLDVLIDLIGVFKITYDSTTGKPKIEVVDPKRIEIDGNGFVDSKGIFHGLYVKEICKATADDLSEMYPSEDKYIKDISSEQGGSVLNYSIYTTKSKIIVRLKDKILEIKDNIYAAQEEDRNYVNTPFNYVFLTLFNSRRQPHDYTSLILQNIPAQSKLNKINEQIYNNMAQVNGSILIDSKKKLTHTDATEILRNLRDEGYIFAEPGAVTRFAPPVFGAEIYNEKLNLENTIRKNFGVAGSTTQGIQEEKTVGGKMLTRQLDQTKIGGSITYNLEQCYDSVFNWCVHIMANMMTEETTFAYEGETVKFSGVSIKKPLSITVKENSLIPRDPINDAQMAKELFQMGAIGQKSLLEMMHYPNPEKAIEETEEMKQQMEQPLV